MAPNQPAVPTPRDLAWLDQVLGQFTEDQPEYWELVAYLFSKLSHRAEQRAALIRHRRAAEFLPKGYISTGRRWGQ